MASEDESTDGPRMYQNLRKLINIVDQLRDLGLQKYINLPRICVVGTQSSGKSSVLEAIMGLDFLPRGEGIVTRRPIELRLVHLSEAEHNLDEAWVVFEDQSDKKHTNFKEVQQRIDTLTDQVAGRNKGIIDKPIVLTVYATQCPDLTLIDLPGITRVPVKGSDQTDDIERLTREMARRYAEDPRTIILAVLPANADMSTSDALQLARQVDPRGLRTIGVITKIDLMDRGMDAAKMLCGEEVPLRLGYTGLVNRSQADMKEGMSIQQSIQKEREFFFSNSAYRNLECGARTLVDKLTKVLFRHIKNFLPEIRREISNRVRLVSDRLIELGDGVPVDDSQRKAFIWQMIQDYCNFYRSSMRGTSDKVFPWGADDDGAIGGPAIRAIFTQFLEDFVGKDITEDMTDYDLDVALQQYGGCSLSFVSRSDAFTSLMPLYLSRLRPPVFDTLERVAQALEQFAERLTSHVFGRFPKLAEKVLEVSRRLLEEVKESARLVLEDVVKWQTEFLFTNDPDFLAELDKRSTAKDKRENQHEETPSETIRGEKKAKELFSHAKQSVTSLWAGQSNKKLRHSEHAIKATRKMVNDYFNVVLHNLRDEIPRAIGMLVVRKLEEKQQFSLVHSQLSDEKNEELLGEPAHIAEERRNLNSQLVTLRSANQVLQQDRSIASFTKHQIDDTFDTDVSMLHAAEEKQPIGVNSTPHNGALLPPPTNKESGGASPGGVRTQSDIRKSSVSGLFDKPSSTAAVQPKSLFEKDPSRRAAVPPNPLFTD